MRPKPVWTLLVAALGSCSEPAKSTPRTDVAAEADRIEADFEAFCLASGGDPKRVEAALTEAGWVEPLKHDGLRGFEERLPGNRFGGGLAIFGKDSCEVLRDSTRTDAVAETLGRRMASRYGVTPAMRDPLEGFCANAVVGQVTYKACQRVFQDAPASASLEVLWRPDESGLAAESPATPDPTPVR